MNRKIKKYLLVLYLCFFASTIFPGFSLAADKSSSDTISVLEAKKAAIFQITMDSKLDDQSPWHNKKVKFEEPLKTYDTSDSLSSYLFSLTIDGKPAGFVEVSALRDEYPILSYSYEESDITTPKIAKFKGKNNMEGLVTEKVVLLGPGTFGLKQDYADGSAHIQSSLASVDLPKEKNKPRKKRTIERNNDARSLRENINLVVGEIGNDHDGVTDDLDFETGTKVFDVRGGCGDLNQLYSSLWTGPAGCAPTAAANIMLYWDAHDYPALTEDFTDEELVYELRQAMGTFYDSSTGMSPTPVNNISPGMEEFAHSVGYEDASAGYLDETWEDYKYGITEVGPNVISFEDQTYYGDHAVTGNGWIEYYYDGSCAGHRYMRATDNVYSTPKNVYIAWDRDYEAIFFDQFYPDGE